MGAPKLQTISLVYDKDRCTIEWLVACVAGSIVHL